MPNDEERTVKKGQVFVSGNKTQKHIHLEVKARSWILKPEHIISSWKK